MPPITLTQDACWTGYEDVQPMIHRTCESFQQRKGGRISEQNEEAIDHFLKAHAAYDPSRAGYTTWIWWGIWHGLMESQRTAARRAARYEGAIPDDLPDRTGFDLRGFLSDLSHDAATVARLALEASNRDCRSKRRSVVEFLGSIGWTAARIAESFSEIREALG